jgi:hypothetical protein
MGTSHGHQCVMRRATHGLLRSSLGCRPGGDHRRSANPEVMRASHAKRVSPKRFEATWEPHTGIDVLWEGPPTASSGHPLGVGREVTIDGAPTLKWWERRMPSVCRRSDSKPHGNLTQASTCYEKGHPRPPLVLKRRKRIKKRNTNTKRTSEHKRKTTQSNNKRRTRKHTPHPVPSLSGLSLSPHRAWRKNVCPGGSSRVRRRVACRQNRRFSFRRGEEIKKGLRGMARGGVCVFVFFFCCCFVLFCVCVRLCVLCWCSFSWSFSFSSGPEEAVGGPSHNTSMPVWGSHVASNRFGDTRLACDALITSGLALRRWSPPGLHPRDDLRRPWVALLITHWCPCEVPMWLRFASATHAWHAALSPLQPSQS